MSHFIISVLFTLISVQTFGATNYVSTIDQDLSIKKVALTPMQDNLSGIYAKPLTARLVQISDDEKRWSFSNIELGGNTPEDLESKPAKAMQFLKKNSVDAILISRLTKGPQGIQIHMALISGKEGLVLAETDLKNYQGFEISDLRTEVDKLFKNILVKVPYDGILMSRRGTLVTVNLGINQGAKAGQDLNVIQFTKVTRHPKFHFLIGTEKEILGHIKLQKVEDNLSFGSIVSEREEGVLQPGQKFIVESFIRYPETPMTGDQKLASDLSDSKDMKVAFGDKATEWMPDANPTFGKIGVLFGLSQYTLSNTVAAGGLSSTNSITPTVHINGEIWINSEWFADLILKEYIATLANPAGGAPSKLNMATTEYALSLGYNILIANQFFGPKFQLLAGYANFASSVDQSTPKTSFTSQSYSGIMFGLGGYMPLVLESGAPLGLGAHLRFFLSPSLSETPVTSGDATNNISSFDAYMDYRYSNRVIVKGMVDYALFSSSFSGIGTRGQTATSSSHSIMSLMGGVEYLF